MSAFRPLLDDSDPFIIRSNAISADDLATPWYGPNSLRIFRCVNTHNSDIIMSVTVSQITGVSIDYSSICSGTDQRNHQSSASLAFVRGIHH